MKGQNLYLSNVFYAIYDIEVLHFPRFRLHSQSPTEAQRSKYHQQLACHIPFNVSLGPLDLFSPRIVFELLSRTNFGIQEAILPL